MNNFTPRKVFILVNGEYQEITISEHRNRRENDEDYKTRKFIGLHGMIMEVSEGDYIQHYREKRRQKYMAEAAEKRGDISYDSLSTDEFNGENILVDPNGDLAEFLARRLARDKLCLVLSELPKEERELITAHFYEGKSQTKLSESMGISQQAVSKKISKICAKLRKLIEDR